MQVKVYAKLNLTLNVNGIKGGFHDIDSVAVSVTVFDIVRVVKRCDNTVNVQGMPQVQTEHNTAYKAACAFINAFDTNGVDISIVKNIPVAAGMGGSSADAVAVIYCMCKLYGVDVHSESVKSLCAGLGSDLNFMLRGGLGRLRGKGDDVEFYPFENKLYFALTSFDEQINSRTAYFEYDKRGRAEIPVDNGDVIRLLCGGRVRDVIYKFNNHLQPAVEGANGYAENYLAFARANGLRPNMTGSGSAYYIAFYREEDAAAAAEVLNAEGFSTIVCQMVSKGIEEI